MTRIRSLIPLAGAVAIGLFGLAPQAHASSSSAGEEYLSITEAVTPNIIFLVDMSQGMADPCAPEAADTGSSGSTDTGLDTGSSMPKSSSSTDPCITSVMQAIDAVTQHYDWARYAVVGTAEKKNDN